MLSDIVIDMLAAEVLSFSGLLPELINSRAAMLGMLAAFGAELSTREPVFLQVSLIQRPGQCQYVVIDGAIGRDS